MGRLARNLVAVRRAAVAAATFALSGSCWAWGDEGHTIVGQIASHYLQPGVRSKIDAILATDTSTLTPHDFDSETTWADKYRDSDRGTTNVHYLQTRQWHFVDIELADANIDSACFNHPSMPAGTPASAGPASDCSIDKIDQFAAELRSPDTAPEERLLALKFLMHFVGDLHQPLHAADDHDAGGNAKHVSATGLGLGKLHGFWDTQFVRRLGTDPVAVGDALAVRITTTEATTWASGTATDWANESFNIAKAKVYGKLPVPKTSGTYALPASYVTASKAIVTRQLSRAGVRLAAILKGGLCGGVTVCPPACFGRALRERTAAGSVAATNQQLGKLTRLDW